MSIDSEGLTTVKMSHKFLYAEVDEFILSSLTSYVSPGGEMEIKFPNDGEPSEVENQEDYVIYDKMYMLMPIVANQWKMFTPPFDVSNVYVIESYPEDKLIEKYGTETKDKKGNTVKKIFGADKILEARYAQSHRMIDFIYQWLWSADMLGQDYDLWSESNGLPVGFFGNWLEMYDTADKPKIEQLYHYTSADVIYPDGKQWWDANFYLYEVDYEEGRESWVVTNDGMDARWKEVTTISRKRDRSGKNNIIMHKGNVYSLSFPSTVVNSGKQHDYVNNWDYWTGKYIILEGYANTDFDSDGDGDIDSKGQEIKGKDYANEIVESYDQLGSAVLRGNSTFTKIDIENKNAFVLNTNKDDENAAHNIFINVQENGALNVLYPTCGYVLVNDPASSSNMPRRIVSVNPQTGEITYRDETTTSLPTIGGNNQMFVYNITGGVGIVPVVEQQVSIYNAAGQLITSEYLTDEVHISLPTGIYLIAGAQDQFKAVVK